MGVDSTADSCSASVPPMEKWGFTGWGWGDYLLEGLRAVAVLVFLAVLARLALSPLIGLWTWLRDRRSPPPPTIEGRIYEVWTKAKNRHRRDDERRELEELEATGEPTWRPTAKRDDAGSRPGE